MSIRPAVKLIAATGPDSQMENTPAAFLLATPDVDLIGNIAGGAASFGFWFESFDFPRGASRNAKLPVYDTVKIPFVPFGTVRDNESFATSRGFASCPEPTLGAPTKMALFEGQFCCSSDFGSQVSEGRTQIMRNAVFVDMFEQGVHSNKVKDVRVGNTFIVGQLHPNGVEGTTCEPEEDFSDKPVCRYSV